MRVRIGSSSIGGRVNIKSKLPSGYQEVEYLESPDVQYIDTGKTADSTSVIAFDFQYVSFNSSYNRIFGARNGVGKGLLNIRTSTDSGPYLLVENVNNWVSTTSIGTNKHSVKMNGVNHNLYYDYSVVSTNFTIKDDTLGNMWLFGTNQGGTNSNVRIFNYTHVKGGILIQKLIPCVRISDNKPGLYDTVNNEFLVNSGTGEFTVGPNVPSSILPNEYQRVDYIYQEKQGANGTTNLAYIQSDFSFADIDAAEFDISISESGGANANIVLCAYNTSYYIVVDRSLHRVNGFSSVTWDPESQTLFSDELRHKVTVSNLSSSSTTKIRTAWDWVWWHKTYWYGLKLLKNGKVIQQLVPCYRKSDGEIGMYDIITKQFLTNQGTGTFLKGSNINNIICKPHITIEGTTNLFPFQYQNGYYISGDSSSTLTSSGQYSVPCTVQGKYTLSGYYKIASTDSATNPRITLSATYSDGTTATLKQDWNIVRDGTWRRFSITGTTNESKTLTTLKGWLFDYSTPGNARNIACKCVQLENKDHATLYTPTSRPDNTII